MRPSPSCHSPAVAKSAIFLAVLTFHLYAHYFRIVGVHSEHDRVWLVFFVASLFVAGGLVAWVWWQRIDIRRISAQDLLAEFDGFGNVVRSLRRSHSITVNLDLLRSIQ